MHVRGRSGDLSGFASVSRGSFCRRMDPYITPPTRCILDSYVYDPLLVLLHLFPFHVYYIAHFRDLGDATKCSDTSDMIDLHRVHSSLPPFPLLSLAFDTTPSNGSASSTHPPTPTSPAGFNDPPRSIFGHRSPSVPSTFLPSYYPESRHSSILPSHRSDGEASRLPDVKQRGRIVGTDPSTRHLLDGVAIFPPRPPRSVASPTYEIPPDPFSRVLAPVHRQWPTMSTDGQYGSTSLEDMSEKGCSTSTRPLHRSGSPRFRSGRPNIILAFPYPHPQQAPRIPRSESAPNPALPSLSFESTQNGSHTNQARSEPTSRNPAFPEISYGGVLLPAGATTEPPCWDDTRTEGVVSDVNYAQVCLISQVRHVCQLIAS